MGESSRGSDYSLIFWGEDGQPILTIQPNQMSFELDDSRERQERCGTKKKPPRQEINGWRINAEFEREDFVFDDMVDAIQNSFFQGQKIARIDALQNIYIPEIGATRTYSYNNCKFGFRDEVGGQSERARIRIEGEAEEREEL